MMKGRNVKSVHKSEDSKKNYVCIFYRIQEFPVSLSLSFPFITLVNVSLIKKGRSIYALPSLYSLIFIIFFLLRILARLPPV